MENLVYSLEATMPVFLLMIAGMLFRRMGLFSEAFTRGANAFVFRIALPVSLFVQLSGVEILSVWDTGFVLFCAGATVLSILLALLIARLTVKEEKIAIVKENAAPAANDSLVTGEIAEV